jgi:hypothetical protein
MTAPADYSPEVLEETPPRATKFLLGIGAVAIVRTQLAAAGMTAEDLLEGRKLLLACLAQPERMTPELDSDDAQSTRAATAELDAWDEPNFARYGAALRRRFPSAYAYVFRDLKASTGSAAVAGVATFLARIKALAEGSDPARSASVKDDAKAVALLETRGLKTAERKRLDALVKRALGPTESLDALPAEETSDERLAKLALLKGWYDEWATTARAVVKKRVYLIRLGLAQRKVGNKKSASGGDDDATPGPA